ncbi:MAG TPA: hypothetical protein VMW27_29115 [Thermoanaerobaculia bacterium]|nr:hypothetical protein [Thermoanaerobaculia bacterium]
MKEQTLTSPAGAPSERPETAGLSFRFALGLAAVVLAIALFHFWPTLGVSWAYDDIDYINHAISVMSGDWGFWETLIRPQGEHVVAGFRLALYAHLKMFGIDPRPFRALVLLMHAASGFFLGLLALRYSGSRPAGIASGAAYVAPCGFSSMWVWFPSGSCVPFALAALTAAMAVLAWRQSLGVRRSRVLAGLLVLVALANESTLAPLVALPMMIDEYERRREGARGPVGVFSLFCAVVTVTAAGLSSWLYRRTFGGQFSINVMKGVPRAAFLLLVAPFRFFFPGLFPGVDPGAETALVGTTLGLVIAAPVLALLLGLWRRGVPRLVHVAALSTLGPLGTVGLVGLGRWTSSYREFYDADRYFFTLLIPVSLLAGAVVAELAPRLRGWPRYQRLAIFALLVVFLGVELKLHRRAMLNRIPFDVYGLHAKRWDQLQKLAERLDAAARALPPGAPPLTVPDVPLVFSDVHNGQILSGALVHVLGRGEPRLRLGDRRVSDRDARLLNPILDAWARDIGEPLPYLTVDDGELVNARVVSKIDFRAGPHNRSVVSGFYGWENGYRWMAGEGVLRLSMLTPRLHLVLVAPLAALRQADPGIREMTVAVSAFDEASGFRADLGELRITSDGAQAFEIDNSPFLRSLGAGRTIQLGLRARPVWTPAKVMGSADTRYLTVQVLYAGE